MFTSLRSLFCFVLGLLPWTLFAANPPPSSGAVPAATPPRASGLPKTGEFAFSLLPKSFQRNPTLEMTVNTEFTDYGRLLRSASPEQPVYYVPLPAGYKEFGGSIGGQHPPPPADLERAMKKALAVNGYLQAEKP